jgi:serine/threonine protein kinase
MGVVYRAHDTLLDRDVAVKVMSDSTLGTQGRARLLGEARAVAQLNHPNVVNVYDAGEAQHLPYIVMELVSGQTLRDLPRSDLAAALVCMTQICLALEHAHAYGIIHRDLKLENAVQTPSGVVKLMDFGLARPPGPRQTQEGMLVGTAAYLAPELISGGEPGVQSDLYALGVMFYELLTGRPPFEAADPILLLGQHLHAPVIPPSQHNPDVSPELDSLVLRLLSKAPADRPASAGEVLAALTMQGALVPLPRPAPHNLPAQLSSFIGRDKELAAIKRQLLAHRLVTLTGSGGVGKSRLAIQVAAELLGQFPDGVWLVELAPLADPAMVPVIAARALGLRELAGPEMITLLQDFLEH